MLLNCSCHGGQIIDCYLLKCLGVVYYKYVSVAVSACTKYVCKNSFFVGFDFNTFLLEPFHTHIF